MSNISLKSIINQALKTFYRFPFAVLISLIGTGIAMALIKLDSSPVESLEQILLSLVVGLPLMIALSLGLENSTINKAMSGLIKGAGLGIILLIYLSLPSNMFENTFIRIVLLTLGFFSLLSFVAYRKKNEKEAFWKFNQILFVRVFTGAFYSMVLFIGLALAILAVENLFNLNIDENYYGYLWAFIVGIVNTFYVLAGIPKRTDLYSHIESYPRSLKVFIQYILIPIVLTYLSILYIYELKIAIQWELPKGWVSYLITSFSVVGILSFLLTFPIHKQNKFLNYYFRLFFWALLPLILLLSLAVYVRIGDYGITENRYLLIVLTLWLSFTSVYLLLNKLKNIRIIPISIFILSLFISFGPWGVFEISKKSQINRLTSILEKNELLQNGMYVKMDEELNFEDNKQICSIVEYLTKNHGYNSLQPLFNEDLDTICSDSLRYQQSIDMVNLMGLKYINRYENFDHSKTKYFTILSSEYDSYLYPISTYDYYFRIENTYEKKEFNGINMDGKDSSLKYEFLAEKSSVRIQLDEKEVAVFDLEKFVDSIVKNQLNNSENYKLTSEQLILTQQLDNAKLSLFINNISGDIRFVDEKKVVKVKSFEGEVFIEIIAQKQMK